MSHFMPFLLEIDVHLVEYSFQISIQFVESVNLIMSRIGGIKMIFKSLVPFIPLSFAFILFFLYKLSYLSLWRFQMWTCIYLLA